MVLGKWDVRVHKSDSGPYLIPCTDVNSAWIDTVRAEALRRNLRTNFLYCWYGNGFLDVTLKAYATKEKVDKLNII